MTTRRYGLIGSAYDASFLAPPHRQPVRTANADLCLRLVLRSWQLYGTMIRNHELRHVVALLMDPESGPGLAWLSAYRKTAVSLATATVAAARARRGRRQGDSSGRSLARDGERHRLLLGALRQSTTAFRRAVAAATIHR